MALLQHGALQPNSWRFVGDDAAISADEPVTVSLKRWQAEGEILRGRNALIGVRLKNDEQALALGEDVHRLALIEIEFPKFTDGRAFSQARILRDKLGYKGELRAIGTILRDQYLYMTRCGVDSVELPDGKPIDGYLAALKEFSAWYQPASDGRPTVMELRHPANANARRGGAPLVTASVAAHSA
ncbi:MAG TPA: DUF934 domain-containing protein [Dongiaceae bacterium]|jgi:uncharacterized protein (DUF934 family)|nr:DUF934 domain-containing protein [Dongiaceae bacterium]